MLSILRKNGYTVVIVGDKNHPEVKSVLSYLHNDGIVLQKPASVRAKKIGVVSQTTLDVGTFTGVVSGLVEGAEEIRVYNTICESTQVRQKEAARWQRPSMPCLLWEAKTARTRQSSIR